MTSHRHVRKERRKRSGMRRTKKKSDVERWKQRKRVTADVCMCAMERAERQACPHGQV